MVPVSRAGTRLEAQQKRGCGCGCGVATSGAALGAAVLQKHLWAQCWKLSEATLDMGVGGERRVAVGQRPVVSAVMHGQGYMGKAQLCTEIHRLVCGGLTSRSWRRIALQKRVYEAHKHLRAARQAMRLKVLCGIGDG